MIKRIVKKCFLLLICLLFAITCLFGVACNSEKNSNKKDVTYTLNQTLVELDVGETFTLSVNASDSSVVFAEFRSEIPKIASVNSNGVVTANKIGDTKITATVNGKTLTCTVRVFIESAPLEFILEGLEKTGDNYELTLKKGDSYMVTPVLRMGSTIIQTNSLMVQCSDGRNVHYDFDEDSIVAIGVTEQAALEFTCTYGEKEYEAVCYVTVVEALE